MRKDIVYLSGIGGVYDIQCTTQIQSEVKTGERLKYGFRCLAWACSKSDIRAIHTLCIGRKDSQVPSRGLLLVYPGEIGVVRARLKQVVVEGMHQQGHIGLIEIPTSLLNREEAETASEDESNLNHDNDNSDTLTVCSNTASANSSTITAGSDTLSACSDSETWEILHETDIHTERDDS
ncbi:unnamed protein product [Leptosia nina]|uniref:Uncharacterized protein n=1 Tax=Leptosia nina TaxID=320188 RepID=A0AAV1K061_9NEOP